MRTLFWFMRSFRFDRFRAYESRSGNRDQKSSHTNERNCRFLSRL